MGVCQWVVLVCERYVGGVGVSGCLCMDGVGVLVGGVGVLVGGVGL